MRSVDEVSMERRRRRAVDGNVRVKRVQKEVEKPAGKCVRFTMLPWRCHKGIDGWVQRNIKMRRAGMRLEGALILIGPPFAGKTTWARRFGKHVYMSSMHCPRAVEEAKHETGYVVCDDMDKGYPYAKQVLSNQLTLTMVDDHGKTVQVPWDRPCIWICNRSDDPRKWSEDWKEFISEVCTVFDMYEREWEYLYEDDDDDEDDVEEGNGGEYGEYAKHGSETAEVRRGGKDRRVTVEVPFK